jgi:hypothetical protein
VCGELGEFGGELSGGGLGVAGEGAVGGERAAGASGAGVGANRWWMGGVLQVRLSQGRGVHARRAGGRGMHWEVGLLRACACTRGVGGAGPERVPGGASWRLRRAGARRGSELMLRVKRGGQGRAVALTCETRWAGFSRALAGFSRCTGFSWSEVRL